MKSDKTIPALSIILLLFLLSCRGHNKNHGLGEFTDHVNVGTSLFQGDAAYDTSTQQYTVSGGGENMWGAQDVFHFLYRTCSGDLLLETAVEWKTTGGHFHRKAGLIMRAGLAPDAPYVDLIVHGDGLVAMQFRRTAGGETEEIRAAACDFHTMRLERHGSIFSAHLLGQDQSLHPVGAISLDLPDTLNSGLAVCSHDDDNRETALFKNVVVNSTNPPVGKERVIESTLETLQVSTGLRTVVYRQKAHFEAPNWLKDHLVFNQQGKIYKIPVSGGTPELLNTGFADRCNNDHGFSADGQWLAISHDHEGASRIFVLPAAGGAPRLVTKLGPSYWHGWSPDGQLLTYCAERAGEYDVYTIPFSGGAEKRLTTAPGLDDGPEYSPDGKYIYFNSVRTGVMKIWRMLADGSQQEQVTFNEAYGDWFAHPSPDGKWLVMISYDKSVSGHPANKNVVLRLMPVEDGEPNVVAHLFGGQGSMNVPNWSPDSDYFAFVSYRLIWPD